MLETLSLSPGDILQIKSTDLPPGRFIKLQPQSPNFLDISDPKAVLENAFRNFACFTIGDTFTFAYNDTIYSIAVLETKPSIALKGAIGVLETDLEVDFAPPVGYEEPKRQPKSMPQGGMVHNTGTMAQAINYASIAPASNSAAAGAKAVSSNFLTGGQRLKGTKAPTPKASTPVAGASSNAATPPQQQQDAEKVKIRRSNGPQPLRLPHGKLFFGYEIKPVRKAGEKPESESEKPRFAGQGQTLRKGGGKPREVKAAEEGVKKDEGRMLGGTGKEGRTLRDAGR